MDCQLFASFLVARCLSCQIGLCRVSRVHGLRWQSLKHSSDESCVVLCSSRLCVKAGRCDCEAAEYSSRFVVRRRVDGGLVGGMDSLENRVEVFSLIMN